MEAMTDSKVLIERLRADWPEILVEKHWMMDSDAIEEQRREAAETIEKLEADNARLREALEEFVASTGVSDDPDVLLVDALVYENAMRVLGLQK